MDFSSILHAAEGDGRRFDPSFEKEPLDNYDRRHLLPALKPLLEKGEKTELCRDVRNVDRTVGTELSGELVMKFGPRGLAEDTLTVHFTGCAGQSFGAFLAPGVTFELVGEANDFVGKGLSGGKIIVRPPDHISYVPSDNVIAGNVIGYGATSGSIFLHGQAGERFAIRNSGAKMVVEGIGDHGCEYMTGGRVAVLGKVGVNFAAAWPTCMMRTTTSIRNATWAAWTWKRSCRIPPMKRNCFSSFTSIIWLPGAAGLTTC